VSELNDAMASLWPFACAFAFLFGGIFGQEWLRYLQRREARVRAAQTLDLERRKAEAFARVIVSMSRDNQD